MKIKQLFTKDIARPINGVVKADQTENETVFVELDEYVITEELKGHIENFFKFYMPSVHNPEQAAIAGKSGIWVSGFFGSGKSHFIKILSYLLRNVETRHNDDSKRAFDFFSDKLKDEPFLIGDIEKAIQKQNQVILFNIDSRADTDDKEDAILKVFLKVFNEHLGYSGDHAHIAHLERDLEARGMFIQFQQAFQSISGEPWLEQRDSFDFYRDDIAEALSQVTGQSLASTTQWVEKLEDNFPLDIANFCKWVKDYLDVSQERRILFFVDEVGQFIGQNTQMMLKLQTITENLGTICGGRAWVVVTSQEDIDAVLGKMQGSKSQDFSKIQGRFERISLSSSNTNEVIEKRLLEKTDEAKHTLSQLYDSKGDIIRAQLSFEHSNSAELANYTSTENFVNSYPFIPYHYNLVQKIFSGISRAGASGQHMSKGERSLIDAFQIASNQFASDDIGRLIPIYSFYSSIKKFLDTAVVRDINHAQEKSSIDEFAINVLQTLFMIRYVDEVKSTLDNLVTLCISEVDQDKRTLRKQIEHSLDALERNQLIARQGDEYLFLTNEEREIEKEIQHTDIDPSDETHELSRIIFDEILRRNDKYTYPENKQLFPISRTCNGMPFDRNGESDLKLNVVSQIDANYDDYTHGYCTNRSADCILIKLADKPKLFDELRTYIKTEKYIRKSNASTPEQEQLRRDKANENMARRKRLVLELEDLIKQSDFYALGSEFDAKGGSISTMLDGAYRYIIENTFGKLKYIKPFSGNIITEIQQTLVAGDTAQFGLDLNAADANPQALMEVEQYITLAEDNSHAITADDILKRFSKRPYGWNSDEIVLLLARLGLANKITFQANQQEVALKQSYEHLSKTQKRANLRIRKIKQQSEANLKKAARLYKDLQFGSAPSSEKELFTSASDKLNQWLGKLKGFQSKASTGHYPGKQEMADGIALLASLTDMPSSFQFIERFISVADDLCDFEEDYSELENFYETQFATWQNLERALSVTFAPNRAYLEKDDVAKSALDKLNAIYHSPRPYREIRDIQPLIENIAAIDSNFIAQQRDVVSQKLLAHVTSVKTLLDDANAPAELSNKALMPFQDAIKRIEKEQNVAQIRNQLSEAEDWFADAEEQVNRFLIEQAAAKTPATGTGTATATDSNPAPGTGNAAVVDAVKVISPIMPAVKPTQAVDAVAVYRSTSKSAYMESLDDVEAYVAALRERLTTLVESNHRVRIK
ncbi:BREX system P-loop protein BrxC [Vibrio fluminensis]|uniref:BREX system P-loop protein BrxC n=1 Tax=Vibrio fluminensis TaxID=2783614 RepID=UPI00188947FC|nr:BREX system P-loop protein BrxC [Vibrio fluminensis]